MATNGRWYSPFIQAQNNGTGVDFSVDTIKVALVTSAYTFDPTHEFFSDITNETSGTGYTAGGVTLTGVASNSSANGVIISANNAFWADSGGSGGFTARGGVFYQDSGLASTSKLIAFHDYGSDITNDTGSVSLLLDTLVAYPQIQIVTNDQLSDLIDVSTSTPTNRNVLVANGTQFESRALVEADISDFGSYLTTVTASDVDAEASLDGYVLTSDGAGNAAWEQLPESIDYRATLAVVSLGI